MATAVAPASEGPVPPALVVVPLPETRRNAIYFFGTQGPHGHLSNFSASPFKINGVSWPTVEHYYQVRSNSKQIVLRECLGTSKSDLF